MLRKIKDKALLLKDRKKRRNRFRLFKVNNGKLRLSVFLSNCHIYAQVIDDTKGITIASASTVDKKIRETLSKTSNKDAAKVIGTYIAKRLLQLGYNEVIFDRGNYVYHGKVKALADMARENGLKF